MRQRQKQQLSTTAQPAAGPKVDRAPSQREPIIELQGMSDYDQEKSSNSKRRRFQFVQCVTQCKKTKWTAFSSRSTKRQHSRMNFDNLNNTNRHNRNTLIAVYDYNRSSSSVLIKQLPLIAALLVYVVVSVPATESVDCFKCSSRNGSNPACEDPFHNMNSTRVTTPQLPDPHPSVIYHTPCYAGKKSRNGLFPASACIKLTGTFDTTGESLVVRHCALDSGSLTQDTELARMSHCGKFQFEGDLLRGCVLACPEDACNSSISYISLIGTPWHLMWISSIFLVCLLHLR